MSKRYDELSETIKKYFKDNHQELSSISVRFIDGNYANSTCEISLESTRGLGDVISFKNMKWLSELLKTDKIDTETFHYDGGCDTCDYGAHDEGSLICDDINPFGEHGND